MNSDRTESDWQGLVSEVRPRRRPGGMGRAELPPAPARAPGGRARAGTRGGRAPGGPGALSPRDPPGAPVLPHFPVYPGATFFHAIWCQPLGRGLSSGRAWSWIGERSPGIREKEPSPTCLPGHHCFGAKRLDARC